MTFRRIAVIGGGYMGSGIAQALARHGLSVTVSDADAETTAAAVERIHQQAARYGADRLMSVDEVAAVRGHVTGGTLVEAVAQADLVIEAVVEDLAVKRQVLTAVGRAAPADAVIATNSSSLGRTRLADTVPQSFLVMHWFNPAPFLPLVELAGDTGVVERVADWLRAVGKDPVTVPDVAGFLGNRLQFALFREAALVVEEGLATAAEVDAVVTGSFGRRLPFYGPLAAADISGLDIYAGAFAVLEAEYGDRFAAPRSLVAKVAEGDLGLKTSGGYRGIADDQREPLEAYRDQVFVALSRLHDSLGPPPGLAGFPPVEQRGSVARRSTGGEPQGHGTSAARRPRLIHLNGPAGIGKSTLAERWTADNPLTLNCDIDVLRMMIGDWQDQPAAMGVSRTTALALITAHLAEGHDVVLPQLVARADQLDRFVAAAETAGADFVEVVLLDSSGDPDAAVARFHRRGDDGWHRQVRDLMAAQGGDAVLRERYAALLEVVRDRPDAVVVSSVEGNPEDTYRRLVEAVDVD